MDDETIDYIMSDAFLSEESIQKAVDEMIDDQVAEMDRRWVATPVTAVRVRS